MLGVPPRLSAREKATLEAHARRMRRCPTPSEALLWRELRGGKLGVRFVRQAVIGRFIVDFFAPEIGLIVEVDGGYHDERKKADERRDAKLRGWGYRVVRVEAKVAAVEAGAAVALVRSGVPSPAW